MARDGGDSGLFLTQDGVVNSESWGVVEPCEWIVRLLLEILTLVKSEGGF